MSKKLLLSALLVFISGISFAQEPDAEGGKDSQYLSRMPGYRISEMNYADFTEHKFYDGKKLVTIEGKLTQNSYVLSEGASQKTSILQVRRNYTNALKSIGATILFEGRCELFDDTRVNDVLVTAKLVKGNKEVWVEVWPYSEPASYTLTVLEKEVMVQEVSANDMLSALNSDGFIALDIHFETGKAAISQESGSLIAQIVALLQNAPELKLSIEGHTDNVGAAPGNKTLSENRAKAVVKEMTKAGIAGARLSAIGHGQEKPVADNRTEEGRARNRRVELVKK